MQIKYCASPHTHLLPSKCIFDCCNVLLGNPCIPHGSDQHSPCGGLGAFASTPFDQPFLHCSFFIHGIGSEACCYCGCIEPHSFKDRPPIACSLSAHMCSEEHEMVWMICRESKTLHIHAMPLQTHTRMYADCDRPTHTTHDREHHSPATDDPRCVCIVCSG